MNFFRRRNPAPEIANDIEVYAIGSKEHRMTVRSMKLLQGKITIEAYCFVDHGSLNVTHFEARSGDFTMNWPYPVVVLDGGMLTATLPLDISGCPE